MGSWTKQGFGRDHLLVTHSSRLRLNKKVIPNDQTDERSSNFQNPDHDILLTVRYH